MAIQVYLYPVSQAQLQHDSSQNSHVKDKPAQMDNVMSLRCVQDYVVLQSFLQRLEEGG